MTICTATGHAPPAGDIDPLAYFPACRNKTPDGDHVVTTALASSRFTSISFIESYMQ